jgi:NAD(P)H-dependent FMN reductase
MTTTIISGTNRLNSMSRQIAQAYATLMDEQNYPNQIKFLENIPEEAVLDAIYRKGDNKMRTFAHSIFNESNRLVIVVPEYNASMPGILKLVIDSCDPSIFKGKKIALIGISSGRAGNIRGLDHVMTVFNYLQSEVYSNKLPISQIYNLMDADKNLSDVNTIQALKNHIAGFGDF